MQISGFVVVDLTFKSCSIIFSIKSLFPSGKPFGFTKNSTMDCAEDKWLSKLRVFPLS